MYTRSVARRPTTSPSGGSRGDSTAVAWCVWDREGSNGCKTYIWRRVPESPEEPESRLEDASGRLVVALHVEHLAHALVDVQFVLRVNAAKLESGVWRSRRAAQRWRAWSCASQRSSARANSCARARRGRWPSRAWLRCSSSCAAFRSCSRSCRRSAARLIATQLEEAQLMLEGYARARRGRRGVGLGRRGAGIVSSR